MFTIISHCERVSEWVKVTQSCPTLCDSMDCSLLGSSIHGILQLFPSPGSSSQPRDWAQVSHFAGGFFTIWTTRKAQYLTVGEKIDWIYSSWVRTDQTCFSFPLYFILQNKFSEAGFVCMCVCVCGKIKQHRVFWLGQSKNIGLFLSPMVCFILFWVKHH